MFQLLEKEATKRLGSLGCNSGDDVMAHDFFRGLDWPRLEKKEIEPPYKPRVVSNLISLVVSMCCDTHLYIYRQPGRNVKHRLSA